MNEEILRMIDTQRSIWNTLRKRKKRWIGHLIKNNAWITTLIEGRINRKTDRGRLRTLFMKQVMEDTEMNTYAKLK